MKKVFLIRFAKLHGAGNDFIVSRLEAAGGRAASRNFLRRLARAICARRFGVGADGFLLLEPARQHGNDIRLRFFNADGTEAEISGNGLRCVGGFLRKSGNTKNPLRIETAAGVKSLEEMRSVHSDWTFRVAMGCPILEPGMIPFAAKRAPTPVVGFPLATRLGRYRVTVTSMGNPHCSLFVKDFTRMDWPAIGSEIESHSLFPKRTNVEFVKIVSRRKIEVRYWERGVGITASSGTGSCGAVVASILNGYTDRKVGVQTAASMLKVEWAESGQVFLTGPAKWIAEGTYAFEG